MDKIKFSPANGTGCYLCQTESERGEAVSMYMEIDRNEIDKLRKVVANNPVDYVCVYFNKVRFRFGWLDEESSNEFPKGFFNCEVEKMSGVSEGEDEWEIINNILMVGLDWWQVEIRYPDTVHAYSESEEIDW